MVYKATANYAPADERSIKWNDPELAIEWPRLDASMLSERDRSAPLFREAELLEYGP